MEQNENMAVQDEGFGAEDLLSEEIVEEPQDDSVSLEEVLNETEQGESGEQPQSAGGKQEPGYVRSRIDKAVQKAVAETEARLTAQFEAQMAPYREQMLNAQAQELLASGKVKDLETAKELVRYRQGQPQTQPAESQPRNEKGQFTAQEESSSAASERVRMLKHQADRIKAAGGPDVIAATQNDEEIKQKIINGEIDFYDVAEQLKQNGGRRKPPSPMRSPNGASGAQKTAIESMTDEQFARLVKKVQGGARYSMR